MNLCHRFTLPNGLPVLFVPTIGTTVSTIVLVAVGSRYETKTTSGIAHFIEHMHFKGTTKRPTFLELNKDLDSLGAEYNAFTDREVTGYWIKSQSETMEQSHELLSDVLFSSTFPEGEMAREKQVIIEEIKMYEDNPMLKIGELLIQAVHGDTPLGWNIAGDFKSVSSFTHKNLMQFHRTHYSPKNMLLVIAGGVKDRRVHSSLRRFFGSDRGSVKHADYRKQHTFRNRIALKRIESNQVTCAFSLPAFRHKDPRLLPLKLLSIIVGEGMSSRLFTEIRERRGLCYSVSSGVDSLYDTGSFLVSAGLDKVRFHEAFTAIWDVLEGVRRNGVTEEELFRAKTNSKGKFLISMEDSVAVARFWGSNALFKQTYESPTQLLKRLERVSLRDLNAAAKLVIDRKKMSLAVIGAFKNEGEIKKVVGNV